MKIRILSDLHLEFSEYELTNPTNANILILSGDILTGYVFHKYRYGSLPVWDDENVYGPTQTLAIRFRRFFENASRLFEHVVYVAGNHELYHGNFYQTLEDIKEECFHYGNIHFLENSAVDIDDIKFIGSTLWTDLNNYDPLTEYYVKDGISDYSYIRNDHAGFRKLFPRDTIQRHEKSFLYIQKELAYSKNQKVVICTHHAPSSLSIDQRFEHDREINGAYFSRLEDFILDNPNIVLWTHGHVHQYKNYTIGDTQIICNPRGYVAKSKQYTGWDEFLTFAYYHNSVLM